MTRYLAHDDPVRCVAWALDCSSAHINKHREHREITSRSDRLLQRVLAKPEAANLNEMEELLWIAWAHPSAAKCGQPLARLISAAMGVVVLVKPDRASGMEPSRIFSAGQDNEVQAHKLVSDESAMAMHMVAREQPNLPQQSAEAFTQKVCFSQRPLNCEVQYDGKWEWGDCVYGFTVLRTQDHFYFEFFDRAGDGRLYSGPCASLAEVEVKIELLQHRPKMIRITPRNR